MNEALTLSSRDIITLLHWWKVSFTLLWIFFFFSQQFCKNPHYITATNLLLLLLHERACDCYEDIKALWANQFRQFYFLDFRSGPWLGKMCLQDTYSKSVTTAPGVKSVDKIRDGEIIWCIVLIIILTSSLAATTGLIKAWKHRKQGKTVQISPHVFSGDSIQDLLSL